MQLYKAHKNYFFVYVCIDLNYIKNDTLYLIFQHLLYGITEYIKITTLEEIIFYHSDLYGPEVSVQYDTR